MYVDKRNNREEIKKSLSSCRLSCRRVMVVPRTNKQNVTNMMETLLFTHLSSSTPLCLSVILSFQKKKILMLLAYFPKKHFGTKNCTLAPLMTCKETGKIPPLVVWLEEGRWELNIKKRERQKERKNERETERQRSKCLTWEIFYTAISALRVRFHR